MEEAMEEPDNATPLMHTPTIPVEDAEFIPQKHNFAEKFDRECFVGKEKVPKLHRNGVPVRVNGKQQMEERVNIKGGPKADFLLEKGLNESSKPQDWFNAFLPIFVRKGKNPQNVNTQFWMHKWAFWTNQKAISCSAGVPGGVNPSFAPFSYLEIEHWSLHLARVEPFSIDRNEILQPTNGSSSRKQPLLPCFWCKCGRTIQAVQSFLLCSISLQNPTQ